MDRLHGFFVGTTGNNSRPVDIVDTCDNLQRLIGCRIFDIVTRMIGDRYFDIVCDEEGACIEDPVITAIDCDGNIMFVGNLFIVGEADEDGNLTSITADDEAYIRKYLRTVIPLNTLRPYEILTCVEYA